jgi:DNA-directed RNA polymerase specialized sigma24 family protein
VTPAEEARFIALWQAGTETAAIARQLGIPVGTVSSRAHALRQQGKIEARPKGGNYPRSTTQGRQDKPRQKFRYSGG